VSLVGVVQVALQLVELPRASPDVPLRGASPARGSVQLFLQLFLRLFSAARRKRPMRVNVNINININTQQVLHGERRKKNLGLGRQLLLELLQLCLDLG
jgi:hypothetical protein